jgi:tRNA modification GTPase
MSPSLDLDDTIAAIASAPGGALRGIVRLSGPAVAALAAKVFAADDPHAPKSGRATCSHGQLKLPRDLPPCPATLYFWPTDRSYTRQPSAELHLPGSPPIIAAALEAVCQAGSRLARPGEFTLRAFLAGRLDLTQAEAVLGVIDARNQAELDTSLTQLAGGLAQPLGALRQRLLELLAHLESGLDFVDEDIQFISHDQLDGELFAAASAIEKISCRLSTRSEAGTLARVVLLGRPNAGKSSLFNVLAGSDAAIVSPDAGTTRDFVACRAQCDGVEFLLIDTAGAAEDASLDGPVSAAAHAAMRGQLAQANLTLHCLDASDPRGNWNSNRFESERQTPRLIVWTKCDLACPPCPGLLTSSHTGQGIAELRRAISRELQAAPLEAATVAGTAERCRDSLGRAAEALSRAREAARAELGEELVAAEVRAALDELGQVVGAVYTDDLLDRIFSRFCIGK